jgi:3-oxoacyl-[acyl-carrier-protein] synthase-3
VELGYHMFKPLYEKYKIKASEIDYFLPHLSSEFFRFKIAEKFDANDITIPQEKWFTNLATLGNVGAGSIYMMLEELFNSGKLKKGEKIFLLVPESSRFSYMYALLTVV